MPLSTAIAQLPRMQPSIAKKFTQLGLITLRDALFYFPFRHEDWRHQSTINELAAGQDVTVSARVVKVSSRRAWHRPGTSITNVVVADDHGGHLQVVWFNMPFLMKSLHPGDRLFLSGTVTAAKNGRLQLHNPVYERPSDDPLHRKLVPVYRTTEGLSQRQLRLVVKQACALVHLVPDPLPQPTVEAWQLLSLPEAISQIHFPDSPAQAKRAVERLKFDELLAWHLRLLASGRDSAGRPAPLIPFHEVEIRSFVQHLPFSLTADQRVAAWQALQDMAQPRPMSRLIQGDVGSGKTVVAALVAYNATLSHFQVAVVSPTVILAEQHWQTFRSMIGKHETPIALLTGHHSRIFRAGTETEVSRDELVAAVAGGTISVVIGTHAVLQPDVLFRQLGLVVVDEQQRFGVDQRQVLLSGRAETPHYLSLTATPIPRSFALWLGGILSISAINTKPAGRLPITTKVFGPAGRTTVDRAIATTVSQGQQVYVITPLIEESDSLGARAATTEHERLVEALPHARVGLIHGAMPAVERVAVLDRFRRQAIDVLVSTTVIEVGVDVPNATLIVIEGADRFGLAQLHQLRGRVGRGRQASQCFLVTDRVSPDIEQRLARVAATTDGFAIAELDLQERGGGDLYGQRQSGLPTWQLASLHDQALFERVRQFAATLAPPEQARLVETLTQTDAPPAAWHPE